MNTQRSTYSIPWSRVASADTRPTKTNPLLPLQVRGCWLINLPRRVSWDQRNPQSVTRGHIISFEASKKRKTAPLVWLKLQKALPSLEQVLPGLTTSRGLQKKKRLRIQNTNTVKFSVGTINKLLLKVKQKQFEFRGLTKGGWRGRRLKDARARPCRRESQVKTGRLAGPSQGNKLPLSQGFYADFCRAKSPN